MLAFTRLRRWLMKAGRRRPGGNRLWHHPEEESAAAPIFSALCERVPSIPQDMVCLELAPSDYAVFTTVPPNIAKGRKSFRKALDELWIFILLEWFHKESNLFLDQEKPSFEYYPAVNVDQDAKVRPVELFLPIVKKGGNYPKVRKNGQLHFQKNVL